MTLPHPSPFPDFAHLMRALRVAGLCGLWALAPTADFAGDPPATAADRLGYHFDQRVHDAAQEKAATAGAGAFDTEPLPAGVERLPRYVVKEKPVPLADRALLTPKGRDAVAQQRYLSPLYQKTLGPLAALASLIYDPLRGYRPNSAEASALYEQDEAIRRASEETDLRELATLADSLEPASPDPVSTKDATKP